MSHPLKTLQATQVVALSADQVETFEVDQAKTLHADQNCIFCKIIAGLIPCKLIYQTEFSLVFQDIAPQAPIHYLIIPKKHIQDIASCSMQDADIIVDMITLTQYLSSLSSEHKAFKLLTNNGYAAGQRVFHLHFHFMAGKHTSQD